MRNISRRQTIMFGTAAMAVTGSLKGGCIDRVNSNRHGRAHCVGADVDD
jgi:hypothetical protein